MNLDPTVTKDPQSQFQALGKSINERNKLSRVRQERLAALFNNEVWRLGVLQPWALGCLRFRMPELSEWTDTFDPTVLPDCCYLTIECTMNAMPYQSMRRPLREQFSITTIDGHC